MLSLPVSAWPICRDGRSRRSRSRNTAPPGSRAGSCANCWASGIRAELDGFLKARGVDEAMTKAEFEHDRQDLDRLGV